MQTYYPAAIPWDHSAALIVKEQSGNNEEGWFTVTSARVKEQDMDGKGIGNVTSEHSLIKNMKDFTKQRKAKDICENTLVGG